MSNTVPATSENPGKVLGIVGLILAFFVNLVGLIVSIVALRKSKAAGHKNGFAVAGIIVSILSIVGGIILVVTLVGGATALAAQCAEYGPGAHELDNGVTITCG
jgi:Ca2+/H+ antiporter